MRLPQTKPPTDEAVMNMTVEAALYIVMKTLYSTEWSQETKPFWRDDAYSHESYMHPTEIIQ